MTAARAVTECRVVADFEKVCWRLDNVVSELIIGQGRQESLLITGQPTLLSSIGTEVRDGRLLVTLGGGWPEKVGRALSTSLTRQRAKCDLNVKSLTSLDLSGLVRAQGSNLESERLKVSLRGAGMVTLEDLTVQLLDVVMRGTCQMRVTGRTVQQRVRLEGMGSYCAPRLKSRRTTVELNGSGRVCVWAVEDLDVTCRGLGRVEYVGTPTVRADTAVLASVVRAQTQAEQANRR